MPRPVRLRLSRREGFVLQLESRAVNGLPATSCARPTKWGNPFRVGEPHPLTGVPMDAETCVDLYRRGIVAGLKVWEGGTGSYLAPDQDDVYRAWEAVTPHLTPVGLGIDLPDLRGRNLACWCPIDAEHCHADVLLQLANGRVG